MLLLIFAATILGGTRIGGGQGGCLGTVFANMESMFTNIYCLQTVFANMDSMFTNMDCLETMFAHTDSMYTDIIERGFARKQCSRT